MFVQQQLKKDLDLCNKHKLLTIICLRFEDLKAWFESFCLENFKQMRSEEKKVEDDIEEEADN